MKLVTKASRWQAFAFGADDAAAFALRNSKNRFFFKNGLPHVFGGSLFVVLLQKSLKLNPYHNISIKNVKLNEDLKF